jgi:hypothetical protein
MLSSGVSRAYFLRFIKYRSNHFISSVVDQTKNFSINETKFSHVTFNQSPSYSNITIDTDILKFNKGSLLLYNFYVLTFDPKKSPKKSNWIAIYLCRSKYKKPNLYMCREFDSIENADRFHTYEKLLINKTSYDDHFFDHVKIIKVPTIIPRYLHKKFLSLRLNQATIMIEHNID